MNDSARYCTIQVDVDGLWVIGKLLGRDYSEESDPVFDTGIDNLLKIFYEFGVKATFFIVAKDLESNANREIVKRIIESGHEIASHSMTHRYLNSLSETDRFDEIASSKKVLENILGVKVNGFKAPGFAVTKDAGGMLLEAGYEYDSSVLGSSLAYLMELFSGLSYSKWEMMTSPAGPYRSSRGNIFKRGKDGITEIPITTLPLLRLPIHFSYAALGDKVYANFTRAILKRVNPEFINYLFHPLDLLDERSVKIDAKIYGLRKNAESKISMAKDMLKFFKEHYNFVTSKEMYEIARETF